MSNYLVTYDIIDNKNRKILSDIFEEFGYRVNKSVFEITLNKTKLKKLLKQIEENKILDKKQDSLRFYHICENCVPKSFEVCDNGGVFDEIELFLYYFLEF